MNTNRARLGWLGCLAVCCASLGVPEGAKGAENHDSGMVRMDDAKFQDWLRRWDKNITGDARNRYCDRELG